MSPHSFPRFLGTSLERLREEHRPSYRAMIGALGDRSVELRVDSPPHRLYAIGDHIELTAEPGTAGVRLETDRQTVLALVDGDVSLGEVLRSEALSIYGAIDAVADFHDCLIHYLRGALRAPSLPALLTEYRCDTAVAGSPTEGPAHA